MPVLTFNKADHYLSFNAEACAAAGAARAGEYQQAKPFPHIVMNDFLDRSVLADVAATYPSLDGVSFFDRDQERLKFQFAPDKISSGSTRNLLAELNSSAFLRFLEEMTGIAGLIPDPYFQGGGLHLTRRGGHLGIHADFNIHGQMHLERRLNLIVYLNDDWDPEFGGNLELWDTAMQNCEVEVAPLMARAVVFNTSLDSYHGHPDPLTCPASRDRRSIATYYYTAFEVPTSDIPARSTNFRPRPNTEDKRDWSVRSQHFIADWVPRRLQRMANRLNPLGR